MLSEFRALSIMPMIHMRFCGLAGIFQQESRFELFGW